MRKVPRLFQLCEVPLCSAQTTRLGLGGARTALPSGIGRLSDLVPVGTWGAAALLGLKARLLCRHFPEDVVDFLVPSSLTLVS